LSKHPPKGAYPDILFRINLKSRSRNEKTKLIRVPINRNGYSHQLYGFGKDTGF